MTWERATLGEVACWSSGGTPQAKNRAYYGGSIPWAVIGDLNDGIVAKTRSSITGAGLSSSSAKVVPAGTLLLAMYGSIGKLGIAGVDMATNQAIATARVGDRVHPKFLFYYLLSQRRELDSAGKGATQRNISQSILKPWPVPVPPLEEQRRIVAILEDHLSHLDAADSQLDAAARRTSALSAHVLAHALADATCDELPLTSLLGRDLANGRSVKTREGGFPVLRLTALNDGMVDLRERKPGAWTADEAERFLVHQGDFLISRGNGSRHLVGRGGLVGEDPDPVAFPDTLIRARPRADLLDAGFLALVWNSTSVRRQIEQVAKTTAGIYKVNQRDLGRVVVPVPSLPDQRRILAEVAARREALGRLTQATDAARERSSALRRSLLGAAFSGRHTGSSPEMSVVEGRIEA